MPLIVLPGTWGDDLLSALYIHLMADNQDYCIIQSIRYQSIGQNIRYHENCIAEHLLILTTLGEMVVQ